MPDDDRLEIFAQTILPPLLWVEQMSVGLARQQAVSELAEKFGQDFVNFFSSDRARSFLSTHPVIAEAIRSAELSPQLSSGLKQLYESAYEISQLPGTQMHGSMPGTQGNQSVDQASQQIAQNMSQADVGEFEIRVENPQEESETERTSRRLSTSENRKKIIENFERNHKEPLPW